MRLSVRIGKNRKIENEKIEKTDIIYLFQRGSSIYVHQKKNEVFSFHAMSHNMYIMYYDHK